LNKFSVEELAALSQQFDVFLHPARGRHYQILDLLRGALSAGSTVTAEGFIDPVGDSFALLRWPELNFLPVPEDVGVPRLLLQQFHLRPGQRVGGRWWLPRECEESLMLDPSFTTEGARI